MARSKGTRALIGGLVVGLVLAVVGLAIWQNQKDACERWQQEYEELMAEAEQEPGVLSYVNLFPAAEHEKRQPDGCEIPE